MRRAANYGFAQHALVQPTAQDFFLAQQALVQPALQVFDTQHPLADPPQQLVVALEEPQELRAKAETARTDIIDRLWITFFIDLLESYLFYWF